MSKDVRFVSVSTSGVQNKTTIIETGVTQINGAIIDRNTKIHIHEVDLVLSAAGTVTLYLGDDAIWERTLAAAGEVHTRDDDRFIPSNENRILSISVSAAIDVTGRIFFSPEYTGGKVVKETEGR
jgi:hypothetical protein